MRDENYIIKYSTWQLLKDIGGYLKPYRWKFTAASFLRLISDLAGLYPAYALAAIVTFLSGYSRGGSLSYFWRIIIIWTLAVVIRSLSRQTAKYIGYQVSERVALDAQLKTIKQLFLIDIAWHDKENSGNKLKRIQKGSYGLDRILRMWINNFIEIGVNFIGMVFILGKVDQTVGILTGAFLAVYFGVSFSMLRKASKASQLVDIKEEEIMGVIFQAMNNIRSVKVLALAGKIGAIIIKEAGELFKKIKYRIFCFQTRTVVLDSVITVFRVGIIVTIVLGIVNGRYELGFLILFNGYFNSIIQSVSELADTTQELIVYKYGIARMQATLAVPVVIEDEAGKKDFPVKWKKISVKNLTFSYGKQEVISGMSFEIKRGERIGIVGLSGAGKSTLMKLLLKENENYQGEILIDSLPLREIKKKSYLDRVGVVLQDTEVFNFTLRENITITGLEETEDMGGGNAESEKLNDAIKIANVDDYLPRLPKGLDTFIGEKGVRLSGGERQRLGIARAVYKKPELLFLDEATSHLDLESEGKIRESLHRFFKKVTALVIAHRLTTIREMDKILVIEGGRVVEMGSYAELYGKKGRFYELWNKQKL
ncbi:MAG: ABC transporter ATP-binding protein [Patescibacteria group bacterium]|jgi:ABC-type multidrug transport system fused ATPase/permease subunit